MNERKQNVVNRLYLEAVLNQEPEMVTEPYEFDRDAGMRFQRALVVLSMIKGAGHCTYSYDDVNKPYVKHFIDVEWLADKNGYFEMEAKVMMKVLELVDSIVIDAKEWNKWQLSFAIYKSTKAE